MKFNVKAILKYAGITGQPHGDELVTKCPFHKKRGFGEDKNPSLHINLTKGIYQCWSCKAKGNMISFALGLGLIEPGHINEFLEQFVILDVSSEDIEKTNQRVKALLEQGVIVEKEKELEKYKKVYHPYFKRRKLHKETVMAFRAGFNKRLKRVIVPIYRYKERIALVGRSIDDVFPRYLYTKDAPLNKTMFGSHMYKGKRTAILVEGVLDLMWLWQCGIKNVLSPMRTQLHDNQIQFMKDMGIEMLVLFFDNDKAGRVFTRKVIADTVRRFDIRCVERYYGHKDPQKMPPFTVRKALQSKVPYMKILLKGGNE